MIVLAKIFLVLLGFIVSASSGIQIERDDVGSFAVLAPVGFLCIVFGALL